MIVRFFMILLMIFPVAASAQQSHHLPDTISQKIIREECNERIFTRVENIPALTVAGEVFEDSLRTFLKGKKALANNQEIIFSFIVTTNSKILEIKKVSGEFRNEDLAREAILHFSHLWTPAVQNGHKVCAYVTLEIKITDKQVHTSIRQ